MTQNSFKEVMHDIAEIKILKARIINSKSYLANTFGKSEKDVDQVGATLIVITDDFMVRKTRIMKFLKVAPASQKSEIFAAMKRR